MIPYGTNPSAVWVSDAVQVQDLTYDVVRRGAPFSSILAASGDSLYVGYERRFDSVLFWMEQGVGQYSSLIWECSVGGSEWARVVPIQTQDWQFNSSQGYIRLDLEGLGFSQWKTTSVRFNDPLVSPDDKLRYWLRCTATSPTRTATLESLTIRPYVSLAKPMDVQALLQYPNHLAFDEDSRPSFTTVEQFLRDAEDEFFRVTGRYYRPEFEENELIDFKPYGMKLRRQPVLDMLELAVWNGNDWEVKDQGRVNADYHYEPETGMVYISTIFLDAVPPMLRRGFSQRRQQGSFKRGIRVNYIHGYDVRTDDFATAMSRTVVKQAAIDVVMGRDFAALIPSNLDRVSLGDKAKQWQEEVTEFRDRFARLHIV